MTTHFSCLYRQEKQQNIASYSERELIVGPVLLRDRPESLTPYANFRLRVAQKALRGAEKGGDAAQVAALRHEIDIWEEVLKCL